MQFNQRPSFNPAHVTLGGVVCASLLGLAAFVLTGPAAESRPAPADLVASRDSQAVETPPEPASPAAAKPAEVAKAEPDMAQPDPKQEELEAKAGWSWLTRVARANVPDQPTIDLPTVATPSPMQHTVTIRSGDTLMEVLTGAGIPRGDGHQAITAMAEVFDPRDLQVGQEITLEFEGGPDGMAGRLMSINLRESVDRDVGATRNAEGAFEPLELVREFKLNPVRAGGVIADSLYVSAKRAAVPDRIILDLIRMLSFSVDFQREIQPGDRFEVTFERYFDDEGRAVKEGQILAASLTQKDETTTYYLYEPKDDGIADYFDEKGRSVKKTLMRTPVDGARLTSRFGKRRHPILGYTRMHRGADFGAPTGTPIMAAGDGVIEKAGWHGGYGRYVRIRHNGTYKTAYAHMRRIKRGIKPGTRVKQGQIIGYVGSSGRSTGPHLHYEVIVNGRQVNPLSVKLPTGRRLKGNELARFQEQVGVLKEQIAAIPIQTEVASAE